MLRHKHELRFGAEHVVEVCFGTGDALYLDVNANFFGIPINHSRVSHCIFEYLRDLGTFDTLGTLGPWMRVDALLMQNVFVVRAKLNAVGVTLNTGLMDAPA